MEWFVLSFLLLLTIGCCFSADNCDFTVYNKTTNTVLSRQTVNASIHVVYVNSSNSNACVPWQIPVPCDATVKNITNQSSNVEMNKMLIKWSKSLNCGHINASLLFEFKNDQKKKEWSVTRINATLNVFNNSGRNTLSINASGVPSSIGYMDYRRSYHCMSNNTFKLKPAGKDPAYTVLLSLANLTMQAFEFHNDTSGDFDKHNICFQDIQGNKIIPIIVGSVIGAGVIVVLIIYISSLVWNYMKKKRSAAYETLSTQ